MGEIEFTDQADPALHDPFRQGVADGAEKRQRERMQASGAKAAAPEPTRPHAKN